MSKQGRAAPAAPKVTPVADAPGLTGGRASAIVIDDVADGDGDGEMVEGVLALPLHTQAANAARAAIADGRYADHAALHSIESALGAVRNCLAEAERILSPDYADLVERIRLVI